MADKDATRGDLLRSINLRDLGGVPVTAGGSVRRGMVFRSAALTDLAGDRLEAVRALGVRTIVDLRRTVERALCPTPWQALGCIDYVTRDYSYSDADLRERMRRQSHDAADGRATMIALYAELPYDQAPAYTRLFRVVAEGRGPVLFHCAVGKDRTGAAAALILAAAGVAPDDILADYLATAAFDLDASPHARHWPARSPARAAAIAPLLATDAAYLEAMYAAIARRSGTIEAYLNETLGLDDGELASLRRNLVDPAMPEGRASQS